MDEWDIALLMPAGMWALGVITGIVLECTISMYREGSRYKKAALAAEKQRK